MKYYIYGLYSTEDQKIRYVGQTKSKLKQRLCEHKCDALTRKLKNHKCNWIRKVYKNNFSIGIVLIEETNEKNWAEREIFWIKKLSKTNNLVNELSGGNCGGVGGKIKNYLSYEEAKKFISENMENVSSYNTYKYEYLKNFDEYKDIIPLAPQKVYSFRHEWKGWGDFLNKEIPSSNFKHENFISYDDAVKLNKENGIKSKSEYLKFIKENKINAPYHPERTYKDLWTCFGDFFGKNK